jgi:hypothetical protein
MAKQMQIHTKESDYQDKFKKELDKSGKAGIGSMTPKEKKVFFNKIDKMHTAKNEKVNEDSDPCWDSHKQIGMKTKNGKQVPNCVPKEEHSVWEAAAEDKEKLEKEAKYYKTEDADKETDIDKIKLAKEKDTDLADAQIITLKGQVELLKQKLENEKNKAVKPAPNKETGEVPLSIGIAYKHLKDKMKTEAAKYKKEQKKDETQSRDKELAEPKGKTLTGEPKTPVEMNPKINHSF